MTARKAKGKRARKPQPKTTVVPDRHVGPVTLGHEATVLARYLRQVGAEPERVPLNIADQTARDQFQQARAPCPKRVPWWAIDWAVAILETIPDRGKGRPLGRPVNPLVKEVEMFATGSRIAEAAKFVVRMEAARKGEQLEDDEIKARADRLAREVYRNRKRDMPK